MVAAVGSVGLEGLTSTPDVPPAKELEVLVADMETRLRSTLLRLVRPALDQMTDLNNQLDVISKQINEHDEVLTVAERLRHEVANQGEYAQLLTERINSQGKQQRDFERSTCDSLASLRSGAGDLSQRLEGQSAELRKTNRDLSRAWEETSRLQQQHEDAHRKVVEGIAQANRLSEKVREEMLESFRELQRQREELLDDLFGEEKGLTQLASDLRSLTTTVAPLPEVQRRVAVLEEQEQNLQGVSDSTVERVAQQKEDFRTFSNEIRNALGNLRGRFQQDANQLVAHHASMLKDLRWEYVEEIKAVKAMLKETTEFRERTQEFCHDTAELVQRESRRMDALHREVLQDIDEIAKRRKKDRAAWEAEVRETKRMVEKEQEKTKMVRVNLEFQGRLLGLVLEGERVANALQMQDFADRGGEKWLCLTSEQGRHAQQPLTAEALEKQRPRAHDGKDALRPSHELVTIDIRKGLVCGEYLPGLVFFGGAVHERRDLLLAHHRLLQRAHGTYLRGPFGDDIPMSASSSSHGQPGANGGVSAGQASSSSFRPAAPSEAGSAKPGSAKPESSGSPGTVTRVSKLSATVPIPSVGPWTGRQRPGSQGQPQAMGSRGTASGPLGETEPPQAAPLRLPSIAVGTGTGIEDSPSRQRSQTAR